MSDVDELVYEMFILANEMMLECEDIQQAVKISGVYTAISTAYIQNKEGIELSDEQIDYLLKLKKLVDSLV